MEDKHTTAMIALLPTTDYWSKLEKPHVTLVFAGETEGRSFNEYQQMVKDAATIAALADRPVNLTVMGVETYGGRHGDPAVSALKLRPTPKLLAMRRLVERWSQSDWGFSPHATIGPIDLSINKEALPQSLTFNRVQAVWGDEEITFNL